MIPPLDQNGTGAEPQKVLVIDDESVVGLSCQRSLRPDGHEVEYHRDPRTGLEAALNGRFDVVLLDLVMPGLDGMEILRRIKTSGDGPEVVIITGHATIDSAVDAMKEGALDYLSKPFSPAQLRLMLHKVWERSRLVRENIALRRELALRAGFEGMIAGSSRMERLFSMIQRVAPTDGTVLISGESGTGKELAARAVHRLSRRAQRDLLAFDCTALASAILESELFGHVRGAFSGAVVTKPGLLELADKGTLFLDEVANLSLETQGKLLRFLETRRLRRVGDTSERTVDLRLIAATNRDLTARIEEGEFREDLYYRLNVVPLHMPPLRERQGDVPRLATAFLDQVCGANDLEIEGFTADAMRRMESYYWPGNVRELKNVVERVAILCESSRIGTGDLPQEIRDVQPRSSITQLPRSWEEFKQLKHEVRDAAVQELERRYLREALERAEGNVSRTAEEIGIQRTNLHALMRKYGLTSVGAD